LIGPSIAEADALLHQAHRVRTISMNMRSIYSQPRSADEDHALVLRHARERLTSGEK